MENPHAPRSDPHRDISHFLRSSEQDHALGLYTAEEIAAAEGIEANSEAAVTTNGATAVEVLQAPTASAEDSTSSTTSSTLLLRCQVKNFLCVTFNLTKKRVYGQQKLNLHMVNGYALRIAKIF